MHSICNLTQPTEKSMLLCNSAPGVMTYMQLKSRLLSVVIFLKLLVKTLFWYSWLAEIRAHCDGQRMSVSKRNHLPWGDYTLTGKMRRITSISNEYPMGWDQFQWLTIKLIKSTEMWCKWWRPGLTSPYSQQDTMHIYSLDPGPPQTCSPGAACEVVGSACRAAVTCSPVLTRPVSMARVGLLGCAQAVPPVSNHSYRLSLNLVSLAALGRRKTFFRITQNIKCISACVQIPECIHKGELKYSVFYL